MASITSSLSKYLKILIVFYHSDRVVESQEDLLKPELWNYLESCHSIYEENAKLGELAKLTVFT